MSEAAIAKKETLVQAAAEKFESAASVVIVDYRGLTVEEAINLRKQLRDAGVETKVIRNSILPRAAKKVGLDGLDEVFTGPTAVAFSNNDVIVPAKIIDEFAKDAEALEIKGGVIEGKVSSVGQITALAGLPSREGSPSMLLSVLQASIRNVTHVVKAVAEKSEEVA